MSIPPNTEALKLQAALAAELEAEQIRPTFEKCSHKELVNWAVQLQASVIWERERRKEAA